MKDIDIINQLLQGNHLEKQELQRANELIFSLQIELKTRFLEETK